MQSLGKVLGSALLYLIYVKLLAGLWMFGEYSARYQDSAFSVMSLVEISDARKWWRNVHRPLSR